ncbi:hypothetical protein FMK69_22730 [Klebsiella variicola]|nr:hypothetical protein [Klebsiella variicola]
MERVQQSALPAAPQPVSVTPAEIPMILTLDELRPNPDNPRKQRNPRYDDIKASIARRGLDSVPKVTKNPATPDYFIFSDGGNTRYAILRELWEETRDERFYRLTCYVKPWPGRLMCLLGHLAENDLQGKLSFIDRAKGIADARVLYEQESDQRLSLRTFSTLLDRDGYRLDSSEIQRMEYSLQYLYPVFPRLFDNGMGRPQARSLIRLHRALADSADSNPTIVDKDKLFTLFNATATQFDDPDIVFHSALLLPVMRHMLDAHAGNRYLRARNQLSERILTLWIFGLDALATASHDTTLLPRTRPESSGRVDCLLPGEPEALMTLTDEEFIRITSQEILDARDCITRAQLALTRPHWQHFQDSLAASLRRTGEHALVQLSALERRCNLTDRVIRRFDTDTGYVTVEVSSACGHPADCDGLSVTGYVTRAGSGLFIPVRLDARVHYHNGAILARFPSFRRVRDVNRLTGADYGPVVRQALAWLRAERRQFSHHLVTPAPALRLVA